jgi:1,2-diacylglycerol 3-alpha-glucosyltransferase
MRIVFLLHNIFEVKNGVSNKYIQFIKYLQIRKISNLLITCNSSTNILPIYNYVIEEGIHIPFYPSIKIPTITYNKLKSIIKENDIIIFNGELFIYYDILLKIKRNIKSVVLLPNWHTNYDFYVPLYGYATSIFSKLKNKLYNHLRNNVFDGLLCTGELTKNDFLPYNNNIINLNEICLSHFSNFTIDAYTTKEYHFIYTGRISIEKNIDLLIEIVEFLLEANYQIILHIIGDGPYLKNVKNNIKKNKIIEHVFYYGEVDYHNIQEIYSELPNRIFIQPSKSETFGKSSMEACCAGIPLFCIDCPIHNLLYDEKNAFLFNTKYDFKDQFNLFINLTDNQKKNMIKNAYMNSQKYDQKNIFENVVTFLENTQSNSLKSIKENNVSIYLYHALQNTLQFFQR